jgi:hypothetical protein
MTSIASPPTKTFGRKPTAESFTCVTACSTPMTTPRPSINAKSGPIATAVATVWSWRKAIMSFTVTPGRRQQLRRRSWR